MKKLAVLLMCVAMVGCGESEVDKVKAYPIKGYGNYTYGKVLDNHRVCENAEWKAYEENEVKKVSYICHLKKGKVSFNFDDNTAAKLRQNEKNQYIANQLKYLPEEIKAADENLVYVINELDGYKALLTVKDYIKFLGEADGSIEFIIFGPVAKGIQDATRFEPDIYTALKKLKPFGGSSITASNLRDFYIKQKSEGFTEEQTEAFATINKLSAKFVVKQLNEEIKKTEEKLNVVKDRGRVLKERLNNKELLNKEGDEAGETAVRKYAMTHILNGEEIIVWAWNPVAEKYNLERQYFKQNEYGNRYTTMNLYTEHLIYSATNNITDVDVYMEIKRRNALNELNKMIYNSK